MNIPLYLNKRGLVYFLLIAVIFCGAIFYSSTPVHGATIEELKNEIDERNLELKKLQQEIDELDKIIQKTEGESQTLKGELDKINSTIAQLNKQVQVAEKKIVSTELDIDRLLMEISQKEKDIKFDRESVKNMIRLMNESEFDSAVEILFSKENFSAGWTDVDSLEQLQRGVNERITTLEAKKAELIKNKNDLNSQKEALTNLKQELIDRKNIANQNKNYKNKLLTETKNQEENYKKLLADKKKKMNDLEREVFDYEAQMKVAIDPTSFPKEGNRVLIWPVDAPYITQKFGITSDSKRLYASGSHNGVDFRAKQGTTIRATSRGTIMGLGDTDSSCDGVSYGKWVLIKHPNGLATLYAHLSVVKVYLGEEVDEGRVLGYSGNTGYSEGPHLHFTVFVGSAVRVAGPKEYKSKICGTYLIMPLAPANAYLDPMSYLPAKGSNLKVD